MNELVLAYWEFAEGYYQKDGKPTSELWLVKDTHKLLRQHFGLTAASEFGPLRLKAVREAMVGKVWHRASINSRVGKIKRMFRWAVENELVPPAVHQGLSAVAGLRKGRTDAKESEPKQPVDESDVNAVLPHLNRQVRTMVMLQAYTGMRPGEVCAIRPCDVNREGDVWEYRPRSHKTAHHGRERIVYIGPKGQQILDPWLDDRPAEFCCFSPREARAERLAAMRAARKSPVQPSQRDRSRLKPKTQPGGYYTTVSYGHAIAKACRKSSVIPWSPNRLRHTAATTIRKAFGLEAAQVALGHATAAVTQIYAERDARPPGRGGDRMTRLCRSGRSGL